MGLIDGLLELGAAFDWISPTLAGLQDLANGGGVTLLIPTGAGYSGREVDRLLRDHGCKTWGVMIPSGSDTLLVTVPKSQAGWAQYLLERAGVPLLNPVAATLGPARPAPGMQPMARAIGRARRPGGLLDRLLKEVER